MGGRVISGIYIETVPLIDHANRSQPQTISVGETLED